MMLGTSEVFELTQEELDLLAAQAIEVSRFQALIATTQAILASLDQLEGAASLPGCFDLQKQANECVLVQYMEQEQVLRARLEQVVAQVSFEELLAKKASLAQSLQQALESLNATVAPEKEQVQYFEVLAASYAKITALVAFHANLPSDLVGEHAASLRQVSVPGPTDDSRCETSEEGGDADSDEDLRLFRWQLPIPEVKPLPEPFVAQLRNTGPASHLFYAFLNKLMDYDAAAVKEYTLKHKPAPFHLCEGKVIIDRAVSAKNYEGITFLLCELANMPSLRLVECGTGK